jgi:serine/threonine protein kinase
LGPYEILAPIGVGGMGEVWKARDTRLARIVAIKKLAGRHSARLTFEDVKLLLARRLPQNDWKPLSSGADFHYLGHCAKMVSFCSNRICPLDDSPLYWP